MTTPTPNYAPTAPRARALTAPRAVQALRARPASLALLALLAGAAAPPHAAAQRPKSWQIQEAYTLAADVTAGDVTCNHTALRVHAEVTGQVFSVGCDLVIGENSLLHQGLFFSGGSVRVEGNADVFGDVTQIGGDLTLNPNAKLHGGVNRYDNPSQPPEPFLEASRRYLTFRRAVPADVEHLNRSAQELNIQYGGTLGRRALASFLIPDFLEFVFKEEQVRFAQSWSLQSGEHPVELQMIQFANAEQARRFWRNILTFTNLDMAHSVQNSLGEGGHWFFRHGNRSTVLWHRGGWIFSSQVERAGDEAAAEDWSGAESTRDEFVANFQRALRSNATREDDGDHFVGTVAAGPAAP